MTKFPSHYECLNVTRDAPPEVIRAAYRSLSQKHHPDKNVGDHEAVQMMARLNTAYSILSDLDQRELYDLQILSEQRPAVRKKADALLRNIHHHAKGRIARIIAAVLGLLTVSIMAVLWYVWKDNQSMMRLEQAVVYSADGASAPAAGGQAQSEAQAANSAAKGKASATAQAAPSGIGAVAAELAKPSATSKAPTTATKASEYERLTAMLKSMGLGLHKLDLPTLTSNAKPPPAPAKPAEPAKAAPVPAPPVLAAKSAAAREEAERPADPSPARSEAKSVAEASRASVPPVASISVNNASQSVRSAVLVDARACPTPAYPTNAYRNGESGTVLLALLVGNDGRVLESKVQKSSGSSDLDKAARKALVQCRFKPASGDSQAEPTWATLTYVWSLE